MRKDKKDELAPDGVIYYGDRFVRPGGKVKFAGSWWQNDKLIPYIGQYVEVRADGYWIVSPEVWLPTYPQGKFAFKL